jgi:Protein of unknown function (DUF3892)
MEAIQMGRFQITCITKRGDHYDPHQRISHIGNQAGNWRLNEVSAIERIETRQDTFYTLVGGRHAEIVIATHGGRKYLKTDADGYAPNNLLALGECTRCDVIS